MKAHRRRGLPRLLDIRGPLLPEEAREDLQKGRADHRVVFSRDAHLLMAPSQILEGHAHYLGIPEIFYDHRQGPDELRVLEAAVRCPGGVLT